MMKYNRILIVDKEASYRKALCALLEADGGYRTAQAGSVREAKELARGFVPQLAVTDVLLADGDGYDLCTDLRINAPNLPVLFLCADDDEVARLRGLGVPADRWMMRREAKKELCARAGRMLQRAYERASAALEES